MADQSHLDILQQGVEAWNSWREQNPSIVPDLSKSALSGANLSGANLSGANLSGANLSGANLFRADLSGADLTWANLRRANLSEAYLSGALLFEALLTKADLSRANLSGARLTRANLSGADLIRANLRGANLSGAYLSGALLFEALLTRADLTRADLSGANLSEAYLSGSKLTRANLSEVDLSWANLRGANLSGAYLSEAHLSEADLSDADLTRSTLVKTHLTRTTLTDCSIYGISAWSLNLEGAKQQNLNVSDEGEPAILVDNLEVAQFVYLLLNNEKIRDVLNTIGEKGVLILGRFTEERKAVLDAIRNRLRELGFVPMMFDFERPSQQDFDETIKTLAGLSRFIIADITNPKSSPLELQAIMPNYMVPFVPIIQEDEEPFAMFQGLQQKYGEWVLDLLKYDSTENLLRALEKAVVKPALEMSEKLLLKKREGIRTRRIDDYL